MMFELYRSDEVTLFPNSNPIKADVGLGVVAWFNKESGEFRFDIDGDHLPEGTDGYIDTFWCSFDLTKEEGQKLYDELGQWLNEHGDS